MLRVGSTLEEASRHAAARWTRVHLGLAFVVCSLGAAWWSGPYWVWRLPRATFERHCGRPGDPMPAQFVGHWDAADGSTIEIRPETWIHRVKFQKLPSSEDGRSFAELARFYGTPTGELVTCVAREAAEIRRWIQSPDGPTAAPERSSYPALHLTYHYDVSDRDFEEDQEYFIVVDDDHAIDLPGGDCFVPVYRFTRRR
jgi:hypothetical protein